VEVLGRCVAPDPARQCHEYFVVNETMHILRSFRCPIKLFLQRLLLTLPMPDAWRTPAGEIVDALNLRHEVEAMREFLHGLPCLKCRRDQIQIPPDLVVNL
jgi:hypothetical protein